MVVKFWAIVCLSFKSLLCEFLVKQQARVKQNGTGVCSFCTEWPTHNIPTLAERRLDFSRTFFKRINRDNSNVLWYLMPAKRDVQLTARLRCARRYSTIYARTNRYKKLSHCIWTKSLAVISFQYHSIVLCMRCILLYVCVKGCQSPINLCLTLQSESEDGLHPCQHERYSSLLLCLIKLLRASLQ